MWPATRVGAVGGAEGDRTPDLVNAIHALSQLSYIPVGGEGFYWRGRAVSSVRVARVPRRHVIRMHVVGEVIILEGDAARPAGTGRAHRERTARRVLGRRVVGHGQVGRRAGAAHRLGRRAVRAGLGVGAEFRCGSARFGEPQRV